MTVTSTDIVNQAIQLIGGNQPLVTGAAPTFDSSASGVAAAKLYGPAVATVARQWQWDMARARILLVAAGGTAPVPWLFEYLYPTNGIEVWQLMPSTVDANNPLPINWEVGNSTLVSGVKKVIRCDLSGAIAIYNNNPTEDVWDPLFREAVVRLLANEFAMAIAGRPDTAAANLEAGAAFVQLGTTRPD